jgi:hypothetical protein
MAVLSAKTQNHDGNNLIYALLGDPSLCIVKADRRLRLEIDTSENASAPPSDTLMALQRITIKGSVVDRNGMLDNSFGSSANAYVQMSMFNPSTVATRKDGGKDTSVRYTLPGALIFSSGKVPLRNGVFTQKTVVPLGVMQSMGGSKLIGYAWQGPQAAVGSRTALYFRGSKPRDPNDSTGPRITLRPYYDPNVMHSPTVSFADQITVEYPFSCEFVFYDPNGIDVTHSGPDEGLTIETPIRNGSGTIRSNFNTKFQFAEGDYRQGSAIISFDDGPNAPPVGRNEVTVTGRDLLGNFTRAKFAITIVSDNSSSTDSSLSLGHVFNAPNPMRMGGSTTFHIFPTKNYSFTPYLVIKIYSLSGKLVKVFQNAQDPQVWDGRDQTGYPLPPNIYLYQVSMNSYSSDKKVPPSKIQKLVIHPPR